MRILEVLTKECHRILKIVDATQQDSHSHWRMPWDFGRCLVAKIRKKTRAHTIPPFGIQMIFDDATIFDHVKAVGSRQHPYFLHCDTSFWSRFSQIASNMHQEKSKWGIHRARNLIVMGKGAKQTTEPREINNYAERTHDIHVQGSAAITEAMKRAVKLDVKGSHSRRDTLSSKMRKTRKLKKQCKKNLHMLKICCAESIAIWSRRDTAEIDLRLYFVEVFLSCQLFFGQL